MNFAEITSMNSLRSGFQKVGDTWPSPRWGGLGGTSTTRVLAHIWSSHHENVHFYGTHAVDVGGELAKLDADGYRPLRAASTAPEAR